MSDVKKSIEITDAKIKFVSLVDKAANKKAFLLTKQEDGQQGFQTNGRIIKVDSNSHYVTGIVYEPMVADAHDNFMTEAEIEKAAHWFMKNGDKIDLQHSFEEADGLTVVESSVTKADQKIEDVDVKKGTWLMTVEVANDEVWSAIEKGEITGLSMGGVGNYATKDVQIEDVAKAEEQPDAVPEKLNLLERLAKMMGVESAIVKGEVRDRYEQRQRAEGFWNAFNCLESVLTHYNYWEDKQEYEQDESKIRDALADFSDIISELVKGDNVAKALHEAQPKKKEDSADSDQSEEGEVAKAGRKMSQANKDKLNSIAQQLIDFTKEFDDEPDAAQDAEDEASDNEKKEDSDMNKEEIQKMIDEAIQKAMQPKEEPAEAQVEKADALTAEAVQKMIDEAVQKAAKPVEKEEEQPAENALTADTVQKMIEETVSKAFKQRGLSTSVDDDDKPVEKAEQHYLHGIL